MTISQLEIDTAALARGTQQMKQTLKKAKAQTEAMYECVQSLSSMWAGIAHDQYVTQFRKDYEVMREVLDLAESMEQSMEQANHYYNTGGQQVEEAVSLIGL